MLHQLGLLGVYFAIHAGTDIHFNKWIFKFLIKLT